MFAGCTIIAANYLAFARVLAESFVRNHPGASFWVLVIDDPNGLWIAEEDERFHVLRLADVGIDGRSARQLAGIYDVLELSTSVKPWLMQHLLTVTGQPVVYLDPDIEVYAPIDDLASLAADRGLVVTPHLLEPLPLDGLYPDDAHMLGAGVYNLGFLAAGPDTLECGFFEFWQGRVWRHAIVDPDSHVFTDQRWLDWIDCFDHAVAGDPGCNVAYWNVWARAITRQDDRYFAGGRPLRFFHFSGFDPATPWILSKHQRDPPRVRLSEHPDLAQLCRRYASLLIAAGHEEWKSTPYGWGRSGQVLLTRAIRRLYRDELMNAERAGAEHPPGPFDGHPEAFLDWLAAPTRPGSSIPRFLMAERDARRDLVAAFPDPHGSSAGEFMSWGWSDATFASNTPWPLRATLRPPPSPASAPLPGINVSGYLSAELGVGAIGRLVAGSAQAVGLPVATNDHPVTGSRCEHKTLELADRDWRYDVNILCANADGTPLILEELGDHALAGRATAGLWHWEAEYLPAPMRDSWALVDEVWVTSRFVLDALSHHAIKPLHLFPLPVQVPNWRTALTRDDLGLPDGFLVLFCFDALSVVERKNPAGVIEAYCRAFSPADGAHLVIKSINANASWREFDRLLLDVDRPDVHITDGYLTWWETKALMELCDCYVSLHRSEGFGLTLAEAMALGKPVIATGWSGNLDFMTNDVACLVPVETVPVPEDVPVYGGLGRWADPDLDAAARALRWVFEEPADAAALGSRARKHLQVTRSMTAAGEFLSNQAGRLRRELAAC